MSLSYTGLTNYGKTTLPSVESWGTNMNILRDPPKSIMTRKQNKVGETNSIIENNLNSDRINENILVYARGVNPMVGVSYNNDSSGMSGNLAGLSQSFNTISTSSTQSMLPYRIMNGQYFQPPVMTKEELLPLSRQPRAWTSQNTSLGFVDFSKRVKEQGDATTTKEVKTSVLKTSIRPTEYKRIEKPIEQPYETKYSIQNTMNIFVNSGMRTRDITNKYVSDVNNGINKNPLNVNVYSNIGHKIYKNDTNVYTKNSIQDINKKEAFSNISGLGEYNNNKVNTTNYIQDINQKEAFSNISGLGEYNNNNNFNTTNYIQDINQKEAFSNISGLGENNNNNNLNTTNYIQDINQKEAFSNISGLGETKYIHKDIKLDRILPNYVSSTNNSDSTKYIRIEPINEIHLDKNIPNANFENNNVIKTNDVDNRTYVLPPKINPGSYIDNNVSKPLKTRIQQIPVLQENDKSKISKYITNNLNR